MKNESILSTVNFFCGYYLELCAFYADGTGKSVYTLYEDNEEFQAPGTNDPAGEVVKKSIKEKLRNFLTRRPTQESLERAGIIQGTCS